MMHSGRDKFVDSEAPVRSFRYRDINEVPDLVFDDGSQGKITAVKCIDTKHFEAQQSVIEQNSINLIDKTDQNILR